MVLVQILPEESWQAVLNEIAFLNPVVGFVFKFLYSDYFADKASLQFDCAVVPPWFFPSFIKQLSRRTTALKLNGIHTVDILSHIYELECAPGLTSLNLSLEDSARIDDDSAHLWAKFTSLTTLQLDQSLVSFNPGLATFTTWAAAFANLQSLSAPIAEENMIPFLEILKGTSLPNLHSLVLPMSGAHMFLLLSALAERDEALCAKMQLVKSSSQDLYGSVSTHFTTRLFELCPNLHELPPISAVEACDLEGLLFTSLRRLDVRWREDFSGHLYVDDVLKAKVLSNLTSLSMSCMSWTDKALSKWAPCLESLGITGGKYRLDDIELPAPGLLAAATKLTRLSCHDLSARGAISYAKYATNLKTLTIHESVNTAISMNADYVDLLGRLTSLEKFCLVSTSTGGSTPGGSPIMISHPSLVEFQIARPCHLKLGYCPRLESIDEALLSSNALPSLGSNLPNLKRIDARRGLQEMQAAQCVDGFAAFHASLQVVDVSGLHSILDEQVGLLGLRNLRILSLNGVSWSSEEFHALSKACCWLSFLNISNFSLKGTSALEFPCFPLLERLALSCRRQVKEQSPLQMTGDERKLPSLRFIRFSGISFSKCCFARCPRLARVDFSDCSFDEIDVSDLPALSEICTNTSTGAALKMRNLRAVRLLALELESLRSFEVAGKFELLVSVSISSATDDSIVKECLRGLYRAIERNAERGKLLRGLCLGDLMT